MGLLRIAAVLLFFAIAVSADAQVQQQTLYRFAGGPVTTFDPAPSDWIVITAPVGGRPVSITKIFISAVAGGGVAATIDVSIVRRGSANSGGTFSSSPPAYMSGSNIPVSATVSVYSINPTTLGSFTGTIDTQKLNIGPPSAAGFLYFSYGDTTPGGPIYLLGGQSIAINLSGQALPSGISMDWRIEESEQP